MHSLPQRRPRRKRKETLLVGTVFFAVVATLVTGLLLTSKSSRPNKPAPLRVPLPQAGTGASNLGRKPSRQDLASAESSLLARYLELIAHGRELRIAGDAGSAIPPLVEATRLNPSGPEGLHELALTYEKAGYGDKARVLWSSLLTLGPAAEPFLDAAKIRSPPPTTATQNLLLCIDPPTLTPIGEALTHGTLQIPIRRKSPVRIEVSNVRVELRMYDLLPGDRIELTEANVHSRWASFPPEWVDRETETLEAEFQAPTKRQKTDPEPDRKFFGYVVRLYYKDVLQETRADPPDLPNKLSSQKTLRPSE